MYQHFIGSNNIIVYALFFLFFFPSFAYPARNTPHSSNDSFTGLIVRKENTTTWHGFLKFLDAEKGNEINGMSELKKYFHRFGYLDNDNSPNDHDDNSKFTNIFDDKFELAVEKYQKNLGLKKSRKLDRETMKSIMSPRCGVSDNYHTLSHVTKHYTYMDDEETGWSGKTPIMLKYAFSRQNMIDYISKSEIKLAFRRAFSRWSEVIPVNFTETGSYSKADIKIGFYSGDHGDGHPFDDFGSTLAHSFEPEDGRMHFDSNETWSVDFKKQKSKYAVDLESVATHEIGHILGLGHSSIKEAVMYPIIDRRKKKVKLMLDDVEGVQSLYGSIPKFNYYTYEYSSSIGLNRRSSSKWMTTTFCVLVVLVVSFFL